MAAAAGACHAAGVTRIVGLSGGIGSGKSTVARLLAALGATVIDADAIVHELQAPGSPLLAEIAAAFGPGVIAADGSLDRARLAAIVFRDPEARARLGAIVHPPVGAEIARRVALARSRGAAVVVLDIPLLFEGRARRTGTAARLDYDATVLVWVPEETQLERQMARDGCSREEALRRIRAQMPLEEKKALADFVIDNSGTPEETERQVRALWETLKRGAAREAAP
jgi:dephospho-CoA kinase